MGYMPIWTEYRTRKNKTILELPDFSLFGASAPLRRVRFGEQLSFGEIAKVMGCNMRTAQSRVRNALKIMRKEQENER